MAQITADLFAEDARLTALHEISAVEGWLASPDSANPVDAIVVDATPALPFNYEPAIVMERLAATLRPPRLVVVVVMDGPALGRSGLDAMALEMHGMWPETPRLAVENALYYYVRSRDTAVAKPSKGAGPGQQRMWADIAVRTGKFLSGDLPSERFVCSMATRTLVQAMTAEPRAAVPVRFGHAARRIMIMLAHRRLERPELGERLHYTSATILSAINGAVRQLRDAGIEDDGTSGFRYLGRLAERHSVWLRSLNDRRGLVSPAELPTD